ncbi:MAG: radical SAM protein [Chloroflexi bacterium]|nr:radical SAM protein [Chloroflexota bacterium]
MSTMEPSGEKDHYRRIIAKTAKQHQLFSVHWELTYRCNLRCTHCYVVKPGDSGFSAPGPELSTEECKDIIDQLADENALNITFSGGEPLVRSDFFEIAQYARGKRFAVRLLTNGTLITPEIADKIAALYPFSVEMSVYGARAETHDGITLVSGSFERVVRAFHLLHERGVRTLVKTPLMKENINEFNAIRGLAEELGTNFHYGITISPKDDGCMLPLRHRLSDQDLLELFRQEIDPEKWKPITTRADNHVCLSGLNYICINPYGEVFPCVQIKISAGNLRQQSLWAIWRNAPTLERMRGITQSSFKSCAACDLRQFCAFCPGVALIEEGDLLSPSSVACREARLRHQVLKEKGGSINHEERRKESPEEEV